MNGIMKTLIGLLSLFVVIFVVAAFLPSSYVISRTITIDKPQSEVFEYVANFHYWRRWNPWVIQDPEATYKIDGKIRTPGASWSWNGEIVGEGKLTFKEVVPFTNINSEIAFTSPQESVAEDIWMFEAAENSGTKVTWTSKGELDYPIGRYFGLFLDSKILGPAFDDGLANLKNLAENAHTLGPN